jgi:thiamine-phosphate pyrophosphorylase
LPLPTPPLLLITDRRQARGDVVSVVTAALAAGCRWVSLREKDLPEAEQAALLGDLVARARPFGATIGLHGDVEIARSGNAHALHLPAGGDAGAARELLGREALIGLSVHAADEARRAAAGIVDYLIAGPVFETQSKPGYGPAIGTAGLAAIVQAAPVPVLAVGGVTADNVAACLRAGAAGVAAMGSVMRAADPGKEVKLLLAAMADAAALAPKPHPRPR